VFHKRIRRFEFASPTTQESASVNTPGFAAMPSFAMSAGIGGNADVYRLAYQQAQQQVAARRERARRAHEWN